MDTGETIADLYGNDGARAEEISPPPSADAVPSPTKFKANIRVFQATYAERDGEEEEENDDDEEELRKIQGHIGCSEGIVRPPMIVDSTHLSFLFLYALLRVRDFWHMAQRFMDANEAKHIALVEW